MPQPQLSLQLVNFATEDPGDWQPLFDRAVVADRAGIDRLVVCDHVVFGEHLDAYGDARLGGIEGGTQPTGPDGVWLEPMTVLAMLAGLTTRARLATGVLQAALRRPVVLAKTAATLDVLSRGRLDLGVGVGWQREEYEAAGLSFEGRGHLLNHTLSVCQTLWREQRADYDADGLTFEHIHCVPKPLQKGGVPIWIGGSLNARVLDRLVRFASGWIPWGPSIADTVGDLVQVRQALADAGRDPMDLEVQGQLPVVRRHDRTVDIGETMEGVPALVDGGITDFRVNFSLPADPHELADRLADIVGSFRQAVGREA